jgi:hypothetical protein
MPLPLTQTNKSKKTAVLGTAVSPEYQSFFALNVAQIVSALEQAKLGPTLIFSAVQWQSPAWY